MTPSQRNPEDRPVAALLAPDILALLEESPARSRRRRRSCTRPTSRTSPRRCRSSRSSAFLAALPTDRARADVLEYLDEELRAEFLEAMTPSRRRSSSAQMTPDERADVLEELDEERAEEISPRCRRRRGARPSSSSRTSRTPPAA